MKLYTRHYLLLLILVVGLLGLSGCGQEDATNGSQPVTTVNTTLGTTQLQTKGSGTATKPAPNLNIDQLLKPVLDIPLPGSSARFDYQSLDSKAGLLFIAHLGDSSLVVYDIKNNKVLSELKGLGGIHGVLAIPELGRVYATATSDHEVVVIDEASLKILARIPAGNYPDGLAYDPLDHKLYISDEGGDSEPVIDTQSNKAINSISLRGEAGNTQYDSVSQHIFIDVQSRNELVEVDPKTDSIISRFALADCQNDHGLQLDSAQRLAFVACAGNAKLLILDIKENMKVLSVQTVGSDPDVLALDSEKQLLYVACESGIISIFKVARPSIQKLAEGFLANGAHIITVDSTTHRVFLPLPEINGKPTLKIMQPL